jgi:hypothetical protein
MVLPHHVLQSYTCNAEVCQPFLDKQHKRYSSEPKRIVVAKGYPFSLKKGDVLASKNPSNPWVVLTSDLPGFVPSCCYWIFRPRKPDCKDVTQQLPSHVLSLYPLIYAHRWETTYTYSLKAVFTTPLTPCNAKEAELAFHLFSSFDELRVASLKKVDLLDKMHRALGMRLAQGQTIKGCMASKLSPQSVPKSA